MVSEIFGDEGCIPAKNCKIIYDHEKIQFSAENPPVLILGFLGTGLVGNIVVTEMIDQLKMEKIGFIATEDLPAIAIFKDGILMHPFRLYYSKEKNCIAAICEIPFNRSDTYSDLARLLNDWALKIKIQEICIIQGLAENGFPTERPVYLAAEKEIIDKITKKTNAKIMPRGLIVGPEAAVLNEGLNNPINCYALLTPVAAGIPDPIGAVAIIDALNNIYNLKINPQRLKDEGEEIQRKLMELSQKTEEQHRKMISMGSTPSSNMYL
ncbi:MAG: proteasome assembly chaperone family protein [Promethearchaeota archaeon]